MFMKTTRDEQLARIVLGLGVMFVGSFSFVQITIAGYLIGLLLIGIGLVPHSTEYPEDYVKAAPKAPAFEKAPAAKAAAPKKRRVRRKKSSK
jgi:hypothetical protein